MNNNDVDVIPTPSAIVETGDNNNDEISLPSPIVETGDNHNRSEDGRIIDKQNQSATSIRYKELTKHSESKINNLEITTYKPSPEEKSRGKPHSQHKLNDGEFGTWFLSSSN